MLTDNELLFVWKLYIPNIDDNGREYAGKHVGEHTFKHIGEKH